MNSDRVGNYLGWRVEQILRSAIVSLILINYNSLLCRHCS